MESNNIMLPKEIVDMIKKIEDAGFEAYAVGGCIRDSILGRDPEDWDLTSNASRAALEALFPDAAIVNQKLGVMRITEGEVTADIAAYRIDGEYKDYRRPDTVIFTDEINEDLRRRDFTMNAIAVSPGRGIVDPFGGREDIARRRIRGIGDPGLRFEEDALRILRAIRFAAQLDFTISEETLQAMKERVELLRHISEERIREEFTKTITAANGGKGLRLLVETGVLPYMIGPEGWKYVDEAAEKHTGEMTEKRLALLAGRIDLAEREPVFRLALFYRCFVRDCALEAIDHLGYSNRMKKLLRYAVCMTEELDGIREKAELKRWIAKTGLEAYRFLTELLEQNARVYGLDTAALKQRDGLYQSIRENNEPVFIEDLAVDGNDLVAAGAGEGVAIGRMLHRLLDVVHASPEQNEKELLLAIARTERAWGSRAGRDLRQSEQKRP